MNLNNIEFRKGDMENLGFPNDYFNSILCVFGIFYMPDMEKEVKELWRMVRPGGKLAITTWGPRLFEPAYGNWKRVLKEEHPDLYTGYKPWERVDNTQSVIKLMQDGGTTNIEVKEENGKQLLRNAEDWWIIALGSGLRWTIDQLSPDAAERFKDTNLKWIRENKIDAVETNVIYAVATKDRT